MLKVIFVMLCVVFAIAISAVLGFAGSWVLSFFGVTVPWYACSVGIFLLGVIFKPGSK